MRTESELRRPLWEKAEAPRTSARWQDRLWQTMWEAPRPALLVAALLAAMVALAGSAAYLSGQTVYRSTTVMMIDDPYGIAAAGDAGVLDKLEQLRGKYAGLVTTDTIASPVAAELHLSTGAVEGAVTTAVPPASLLMDVTATWSDPRTAQAISATAARQLSAYVFHEEISNSIPLADRFQVEMVNPTSYATSSGPAARHAITIGIGSAIGIFVFAFFLTQLVRNRRPTV